MNTKNHVQEEALYLYQTLREESRKSDSRCEQLVIGLVTSSIIIINYGLTADPNLRPYIYLFVYALSYIAYKLLYGNRRHIWRIVTFLRAFIEPEFEVIKWETRLSEIKDMNNKNKYSSLVLSSEFTIVMLTSLLPLVTFLISLLVNIEITEALSNIEVYSFLGVYIVLTISSIVFWNLARRKLARNGEIERRYYSAWKELVHEKNSNNMTIE